MINTESRLLIVAPKDEMYQVVRTQLYNEGIRMTQFDAKSNVSLYDIQDKYKAILFNMEDKYSRRLAYDAASREEMDSKPFFAYCSWDDDSCFDESLFKFSNTIIDSINPISEKNLDELIKTLNK